MFSLLPFLLFTSIVCFHSLYLFYHFIQPHKLAAFRKKFASHLDESGTSDSSASGSGNQHSLPSDAARSDYGSDWEIKILTVEHIWFYKWEDFEVPLPDYFEVKSETKNLNVEEYKMRARCQSVCQYTCLMSSSNSHCSTQRNLIELLCLCVH